MKSMSRTFVLWALFILSAGTVLSFVAANAETVAGTGPKERSGSEREATGSAIISGSAIVRSLADMPLATFRQELLDLAFKTATALPIQPHIKSRSRAQEAVITTCLELDQPRRALGYTEEIDNWIRGTAYADLAFYCARHGDDAVEDLLDLAHRVSEQAVKDEVQDWQRDRIRVTMAKTHVLLGQTQQAEQLEAGAVDSESGKVGTARAMLADVDTFDALMTGLDAVVVPGGFDEVRNALETYAQLFNSMYEDQDRRSRVEEKIKTSWVKLPIMARIEVMTKLAGFALDHSDQAKALELVNEAQLIMEGAHWTPQYQIPVMARLAGLRHRAGDLEKARIAVDTARSLFDSEGEGIVNIYRAEALRPVAEAYQSMGETAAALAVYKTAIEAGIVNPNSRPRAEDLAATCRSMALHGVEPDVDLWSRMRQIHAGLSDPW